jgi:hypothetical protein
MTAHSCLWFTHHMNDQFDRADGLGAARHRHCFTSGMRSTLQPNIVQIRSANPMSTRYAVVLDALRPPQTRQFQPTPTLAAVKSP